MLRNHAQKIIYLLILSFLYWPLSMMSASAKDKINIAVLPFENNLKNSQESSIGDAGSQRFQDLLLDSGNFRLIERKRIQDVMKELAFSQSAFTALFKNK